MGNENFGIIRDENLPDIVSQDLFYLTNEIKRLTENLVQEISTELIISAHLNLICYYHVLTVRKEEKYDQGFAEIIQKFCLEACKMMREKMNVGEEI